MRRYEVGSETLRGIIGSDEVPSYLMLREDVRIKTTFGEREFKYGINGGDGGVLLLESHDTGLFVCNGDGRLESIQPGIPYDFQNELTVPGGLILPDLIQVGPKNDFVAGKVNSPMRVGGGEYYFVNSFSRGDIGTGPSFGIKELLGGLEKGTVSSIRKDCILR